MDTQQNIIAIAKQVRRARVLASSLSPETAKSMRDRALQNEAAVLVMLQNSGASERTTRYVLELMSPETILN